MSFDPISITQKSLTANVATLTASSPILFAQWDWINVYDVDDTFDGFYQVQSVDLVGNTFTYNRTVANVTLQTCQGKVREATDLEQVLQRVCLMEMEQVPNSFASPTAYYTQETYPFWTNRAKSFREEHDDFEEYYIIVYEVVIRQVLASFEEDYQREAEMNVPRNLPLAIDFFEKRQDLQSAACPQLCPFLDPRGVLVLQGETLYGQLNTGIGANQFGFEFTIEVPIKRSREQVYYQ